MNPWLERALVSVAASVVSTTVWVTTAKQPAKKKRRRKKKGEKRASSRGKDGVRVDESVPRSPGAQAAHDYRAGHKGGLTPAEFLENVKGLGKTTAKRARFVSGLLGFGGGEKVPPPKAGGKKKKAGAKKAGGSGKPQKRPEPEGDLDAIRDEAVRRARKAATDRMVKEATDRAGMANAVDKLKSTGEGLKKTGETLGKRIKDAMPENLGESLGEAGKSVKDAAGRAGKSVKDAFESEDGEGLGKKLDRSVRDLGRWFQGPGAPRDDEGPRRRTRPVEGGEVVEAKERPAGGDVVEAKDAGEHRPQAPEATPPRDGERSEPSNEGPAPGPEAPTGEREDDAPPT